MLIDVWLSWNLKSSSDAGVLLIVLSILDPKAFYSYITSVLLLSVGVDFVFRGIMDCEKIEPAILLRGLVRIQI